MNLMDPVQRMLNLQAQKQPQILVEELRAENERLQARLVRYRSATKKQFTRLKARCETLENLLQGKLSRELRKAVIETLKEKFK